VNLLGEFVQQIPLNILVMCLNKIQPKRE